jgi:hypothetical protein
MVASTSRSGLLGETLLRGDLAQPAREAGVAAIDLVLELLAGEERPSTR